ncbi:type II toxin-antitoxin system VapC family toxin [Sphingomonas bacterium]|uniref:type II toxin-antitoxin system VapC family toxin n=1 Tax=Sphingomonas bacterium TaxID=1895847 RepID=UPI0015755415|nr:type II toxin-antitoxin system VapC family toxin [Sphingomonas bacterium]
MALLLDTHALLWWFDLPQAIGRSARAGIEQEPGPVLVSSITAFEIATRHAIGKLSGVEPLLAGFEHKLGNEGFGLLPVEVRHALAVANLPLHHRDPFDRLLIAQALVDDLTLVSNETLFDRYGVRRLW